MINLNKGYNMGDAINYINKLIKLHAPNMQLKYTDGAQTYLKGNAETIWIAILGIACVYFLLTILFKNLIPLEDPPQFGLEITGNLILFLYAISFGDKILISFLRKNFNSLLLKHRADEMAPECVINKLFFWAYEFIPPSSPNSP